MERLLRALEGIVQFIPQYELPEITEEGDIIIRRRRPGREPKLDREGPPEVEETNT